jgi:hypothetical protein
MTHEDENPKRPAIHVSLAPEADESLYKWIAVGAEEEGIPCRLEPDDATDDTNVATLAHTAAQNSRLDVGIGLAAGQVAVQERHMPAERPVIISKVQEDHARQVCRLAGANAARLVIGKPLRLDEES